MSPMMISAENMDHLQFASLAASLPVSVQAGEGDVLLLKGAGDWPQALLAALQRGKRRILLVDPQPVTGLAPVIAQVEAAGASILLCETYADHPAVAPFAAGLGLSSYTAVTLHGQGQEALAMLLLAQLRLARKLGVAAGALVDATVGRCQVLATLEAQLGCGDGLLRLSVVRSGAVAGHLRVMALGLVHSACIELDGSGRPRPASAWHLDADGLHQQPSLYESAQRSVLRKATAGGWSQDVQPLRDWAEDAALALSMLAG
jgi:hypothetical protein